MDDSEVREMLGGKTPAEWQAASQEARASGAHRRYVLLAFDRDRINRFREVESQLDHRADWELLGEVYASIDRPGSDVFELLRSDRPEREHFMSADERAAFCALPEVLLVFRGDANVDEPGWAWTCDREVAI